MTSRVVRAARPLRFGVAGALMLSHHALAETVRPAAPAPASPKLAAVSPDPAATSATYGDWTLRCQRLGEGDKAQRLCEVVQTVQVQGQQGPIAQLAFGRIVATDPLRFTAALPTNISLPGSVMLALGDKDPAPMSLTWHRCLPGACIADGVPTPDELKTFRGAADPGRLVFKDAAGRDVAVPVSFRGLPQALDALSRG